MKMGFEKEEYVFSNPKGEKHDHWSGSGKPDCLCPSKGGEIWEGRRLEELSRSSGASAPPDSLPLLSGKRLRSAPCALVNFPRAQRNKPGSFCIVKNFPFN
jgi:hypothetical protein